MAVDVPSTISGTIVAMPPYIQPETGHEGMSVETGRKSMSFIKKLLGRKGAEPTQRVRICVECGMPVAEHKDWCAIYKLQQTNRYQPVEAAK
jgi:hypothetical protein